MVNVRTQQSMLGPLQVTGRSRSHVVARDNVVLQPAAARDFARMRRAAARDGIDLCAASSFRDFDTQVRIWNQKWRGERPLLDREGNPIEAARLRPMARVAAILVWSAPPGASRHHWGSDLDVYDRAAMAPGYRLQLVPAEYSAEGPFASLAAWLDRHMGRFGFYRPYQTDRGGVQPEPWHLSHIDSAKEVSRRLRPQTLRRALLESDVEGRSALLAGLESLYARYVRSVDPPPT
jgi:LAS superfamily LD-carboxypeptidase LdcB